MKYYFGSYGIIRGYGSLHKTLREADDSVFDDGRKQRRHGGGTDRNPVVVSRDSGECWWFDGEDPTDISPDELIPVKTPSGDQARYSAEVIRSHELLWNGPKELAGFR